ncbi:MAG: dephospho-CoA kinase [Candidatus Omnitrophica bacterium]|nr:dephospho-CoA kinase [Candidatus Omnitrophota bacterium]
MIVVGITGGLGTGKSTVAALLGRRGALVIDADQVAHEVMAPRRAAWRTIRRVFGAQVLEADGRINRAALAQRVFRDPRARRRLEAIVHPRVFREIRRRLRQAKTSGRVRVAVVEIPLLIEAKAQGLVDVVVVVTAPARVQRRRLHARGMPREEMARRIAAQMDLSAKVALADEVVDNSDGMAQTRRQVTRLWTRLLDRTDKPRG